MQGSYTIAVLDCIAIMCQCLCYWFRA